MEAFFIAKQPNGKYCEFSTIIGTVNEYNMTAEEYIEKCAERARCAARLELKEFVMPFSEVKDNFVPTTQTYEEFNEVLKAMGETELVGTEWDDEEVKEINYGNKEIIPTPF